MIEEIGIDAYRNDFNMYPLFYWRNEEPADRQGIREIRYSVWESARATLEECKVLGETFRHDFYPLTPYSTSNDTWMAWQFHDAEEQRGLVQAFRRQECETTEIRCSLHGLDEKSAYEVTNLDTHETAPFSGNHLLNDGLTITLGEKPAAAIFTYAMRTTQ